MPSSLNALVAPHPVGPLSRTFSRPGEKHFRDSCHTWRPAQKSRRGARKHAATMQTLCLLWEDQQQSRASQHEPQGPLVRPHSPGRIGFVFPSQFLSHLAFWQEKEERGQALCGQPMRPGWPSLTRTSSGSYQVVPCGLLVGPRVKLVRKGKAE